MKSIAIILSYAMSVAAQTTQSESVSVPTDTTNGDVTTSNYNALESHTPNGTLSVVQPSEDKSSDNSFSINEVEEEKIVRFFG